MSRFRLPEWNALPSELKNRLLLFALVVLVFLGIHFATPAPGPSPPIRQSEDVQSSASSSDAVGEIPASFHRYEADYEKRITALLEEVLGPGNVHVFVTVDSSEETVWETHVRSQRTAVEERDAQGGTRTTGRKTARRSPFSCAPETGKRRSRARFSNPASAASLSSPGVQRTAA